MKRFLLFSRFKKLTSYIKSGLFLGSLIFLVLAGVSLLSPHILFAQTPTTYWNVQRDTTNNNLNFYLTTSGTNNPNALSISSGGNVGIGTSISSQLLRLNGGSFLPSNDDAMLSIRTSTVGSSDTDWASLGFGYGGSAATSVHTSKISGLNGTGGGTLAFSTSTCYGCGGMTEKMRITPNGNVGIGTVSPQAKLDLGNGWLTPSSNVTVDTNTGITWHTAGPTSYGIYRTAGPWTAPYQQLKVAWDTGIIIDGGYAYGKSGTVIQPTGGPVGIGTAAPSGKLDIANTPSPAGVPWGDGAVFAPDINLDNNFTIQTYIDSQAGGGWANKATYAGRCCNNLALQPTVGTVSIGQVSSDYGSNIFNVNGNSNLMGSTNIGGNMSFSAANPTLSASSYFVMPGGLYVSGGTLYAQNQLQARGGVNNDTGTLVLSGSTSAVQTNGNFYLGNLRLYREGGDATLQQFSSNNGTTGTHYFMNNGTSMGYVYGDVNGFGFLTQAGNWALRVPTGTANLLTGGNLDVSGNVTATNTMYSPNWFRSTGATGWYNETYGGGWFMQDGTWVRSYNGKGVYMSNGFDTGTPSGVGCSGALGGGQMLQVCGNILYDAMIDRNNANYASDPSGTSTLNIVTIGAPTWSGNLANSLLTVYGGAGILGNSYNVGNLTVGNWSVDPNYTLSIAGSAHKSDNSPSWSVASDARLKKNVQTLNGSLEKLLQLRGVSFEWKDPSKFANKTGTQMGMIAQEVEKVFPQWVENSNDGYKSLNISGFEGLSIEAMRELKQENSDLKNQLLQSQSQTDQKIEELKANQEVKSSNQQADIDQLKAEVAELKQQLSQLKK